MRTNGACPLLKEDYKSLQDAVELVAQRNGLTLDRETRSNGDCGPDSVLRNLQRMETLSQRGQEALRILETKGRDAALEMIRKTLGAWLWAHPQMQVAPSVTIADIVKMEGIYVTLSDYVRAMQSPRVWVDTPMLWAASAVFEMQFITLVGQGEPQLIIAPNLVGRDQVPVAAIANISNTHFMALIPAEPLGDAGQPSTDSSLQEDLLYQACRGHASTATADEECEDLRNEGDEVCGLLAICDDDAISGQGQASGDLFGLCDKIAHWSPFDMPSQCLLQAVLSVETDDAWNATDNTFQVLQWREAGKLLQWEALDKAVGRDVLHACARQWRLTRDTRQGMSKVFGKSRRIYEKLSPKCIELALKEPCQKNAAPHTCLDKFRQHPLLVLRWRKLWYSLPKADREYRLRQEFSRQRARQVEANLGDHEAFRMSYNVMGVPVCRQAFIAITGIAADTLQRARATSAVEHGLAVPEISTALSMTPQDLGMWVSKRPIAYMDARAWLLDYAKTNGDTSPLNNKIYLPSGTKSCYYTCYLHSRMSKGVAAQLVASLPWFLQAWRQELPWIVLRSSSGQFTKCGLCEYLKLLASTAKDASVKQRVLLRLGAHYDFQGAQRIALDNLFKQSERDPAELLAMGWDKMDQSKTLLPRVEQLAHTSFMKGGSRIQVHLVGVVCPGIWKQPLVYTVLDNCDQGGNMIASIMIDMLLESVKVQGFLPRKLFIKADNTRKETKNTITIFAAVWLLIQLRGDRLEMIEFGYLVVGPRWFAKAPQTLP